MSAVALSLRRSTFDRFLVGALVLLACFGQPNAVYLVVPFFYPLLATYFLLLFVYLLASDDFRVGNYVVRMDIGIPARCLLPARRCIGPVCARRPHSQ